MAGRARNCPQQGGCIACWTRPVPCRTRPTNFQHLASRKIDTDESLASLIDILRENDANITEVMSTYQADDSLAQGGRIEQASVGLALALACNKPVSSLTMRGFPGPPLCAVAEALKRDSRLQSIALYDVDGDAVALSMAQALKQNTMLESVAIASWLCMGEECNMYEACQHGSSLEIPIEMGDAIYTNTTLTSLKLSGRFGIGVGAAIATALEHNVTLQTLSLEGDWHCVLDLSSLVKMLRINRTLRSLDVHWHGDLGSQVYFDFAEVLRQGIVCESVRLKGIDWNKGSLHITHPETPLLMLGYDSVTRFFDLDVWGRDGTLVAQALEQNRAYESLRINGSWYCDSTCRKVCRCGSRFQISNRMSKVIHQSASLLDLDLSGFFTRQAGRAIACALRSHATLKHLNLSGRFEDGIGLAMADMLRQNTALQSLRWREQASSGGDLSDVLDGLSDNKTLKSLELGCCWGFGCYLKLAAVLRRNATLESVQLDRIRWAGFPVVLQSDGLIIADMCNYNITLKHLSLDGDWSDKESKETVKVCLQRNQQLHRQFVALAWVARPSTEMGFRTITGEEFRAKLFSFFVPVHCALWLDSEHSVVDLAHPYCMRALFGTS